MHSYSRWWALIGFSLSTIVRNVLSYTISEGTPLTPDDVEALKKLLKERDSSPALEGINSEVLTTGSSGKVHTTLEKVQRSLRQRGLDDFADNLKEKLNESELVKILSYQYTTTSYISIIIRIHPCIVYIQICMYLCKV